MRLQEYLETPKFDWSMIPQTALLLKTLHLKLQGHIYILGSDFTNDSYNVDQQNQRKHSYDNFFSDTTPWRPDNLELDAKF